jgi:lipoprotein-releasing system ATP-binding protein
MPDSLIVAAGLGKTYGDAVKTRALDDVSFQIEAGEFTAIVGRSGSGKSTLLNLLGLLDTPTDGTLRISGRQVASLDAPGRAGLRNELLGFVFQYHHLLPEFSVRENLQMPVLISGAVLDDEIRARTEETLRVLGLEGLGDKNANGLSGGQKQRVAIARALMNRPPIVLADEPTGNLDTENSEAVYALFRQINREWGTTFLIVTHDPDIASMTDRILEISDGKLVQDVRNAYGAAASEIELGAPKIEQKR